MSNNSKPVILTKEGEQIFPLTDASLVTGLADVATSGDYDDLLNKPTIPSGVVVDQTYDPTSQNAQSGVAMAGALAGKQDTIDATHKLSYNLLSDIPTIPAAQVQTDWNASSGMGVLLNKPTLATVATSGSYNDLSNRPTIPTVPTALSQLSDDSTHRLVTDTEKSTWNGKQNALTFDSTPTADSTNPVTSGGVKSYVDGAIPTVPTISTDIATDKASTTKTAAPSAVYAEVHPAFGSSQPAGGLLPNVLYKLGTLTGTVSISFAAATDANIENEYKFTFTAGSTAPTITWPAAITGWAGNCVEDGAPVITGGNYYEVSVMDGIALIAEVEV